MPGMAGSLAFAAQPLTLDTGLFGTWYADGVLSGLGLVQGNAAAGDRTALADLSNGQVFIQKIDGIVQFYAQVGAYAIPELGMPYGRLTDTASAPGNFFGALPQAFLKIAPAEGFSLQAGKLPTLLGAEYTFSFENFNIERGLLWNQEPSVSRGVQANYTRGPVALNLSLNDGYYANRYNWVSGAATWTVDPRNTMEFAAGANLGRTATSTIATPLAQNNSAMFDLIYTYSSAPLTITPYLQFSHVPARPDIGLRGSAATYSGALLANYVFTPAFQLAGRLEYIKTDGGAYAIAHANLLYGAGSGAYSVTVTPTFTYRRYFARADLSVVGITGLRDGDGFGDDGNKRVQVRGILETGVVF